MRQNNTSASSIDYDFSAIEARWQAWWEKNRLFEARDFDSRPAFYLLDMFPYPSALGLHMGHTENYAATDILGRFLLARGHNVLHPMGWDAFGLPAEQYAIKTGTHPTLTTRENIANFRRQLKQLGLGLDFSREVNTSEPDYYRWTQWIFLQLFRAGLAYVDERPVNWCPALGTVLANEEVIDGLSEVGGHPVERRPLRQWVLRITAYAERLLDGLEELNWPQSTKAQQVNWIGRSEGSDIRFSIEGKPGLELTVFTTRPDTLFGATYMVLAPEHPLVETLTTEGQSSLVQEYCSEAARKSDLVRSELSREKTGVFTGSYAINPANHSRIPIWIADYVLMTYGTGAIMAVPAHDERDYEFANKHNLPIQRVIEPRHGSQNGNPQDILPYTGEGMMVYSGDYTGLDSEVGKQKITEDLEARDMGRATIQYRLRDWLFSRQRYWGEPFPILWVDEPSYRDAQRIDGPVARHLPSEPVQYVDADGNMLCALPIPESELPVTLPDTDDFKPSGTAESPLAKIPEWVEVWVNLDSGQTLPKTSPRPSSGPWAPARRETNTMPQWAGSCWYYLRFLDPHNSGRLFDPEKEAYWGTPDLYMGGAEHAVLHLFYARFWHYFLYDQGIVKEPEPFRHLFHHGVILGEDGEKMSKSRGNVASPDDVIQSHGADTLRIFLMFMGPLEAKKPWNLRNVEGITRFLRKIWREYVGRNGELNPKIVSDREEDRETERLLHQTIRKVTDDTADLQLNTAVSQLMIMANQLQKSAYVTRGTARAFLQLLAPYAPHLAEELWERLGEPPSITQAPWPEADPTKLAAEKVTIVFQVNGKVRGQAAVDPSMDKDAIIELAKSDPKVQSILSGKSIRREIYVPGKIVNLVAG